MAPSTDTYLSMDACPPLEDIAAFIDGRLSPEDRERVTAHLARCESCYEVFAGAAEFSVKDIDGGDVLPFPLSFRQNRLLLLAASVVLTAGVGFFAWQALRPPEITLAGVVDAIEGRPPAAEQLYEGKRFRGTGAATDLLGDSPSFMAGVYLLDLRVSKTSEAAKGVLEKLDEELTQIPLMDAETSNLDPSDPRQLRTLEADVQETLQGSGSFSFGLWAEAGRLAAATRSPTFFERRNNRRFLSLLLKQEELPVPADVEDTVRERLKNIEALWDRSPDDFDALAGDFEAIIKVVDDYEDDFLDSVEPE